MAASKELTVEEAERILEFLVPKSDRAMLCGPNPRKASVKSILFDYGKRGKTLSLQQLIDIERGVHFNLTINRPVDIVLKHKIHIGTDLAGARLIKKNSSWPDDDPFRRSYVYECRSGGQDVLEGIALFEGLYFTLQAGAPIDDSHIETVAAVTWKIAERLESAYITDLRAISEGPLFRDDPLIERPGLPDPDIGSPTVWPEVPEGEK